MNISDAVNEIACALDDCGLSVAKNRNEPISGYPAAIIAVESVTPAAYGGATDASVAVTVLASRSDRVDAWERMFALIDDNVVLDAIHTCNCVAGVTSIDNIGADVEYNETVALGFVINITVAL